MFSKKIEDIFNNSVNFDTDISFTEMKNISHYLIHSLLKHINIVIDVSKRQNSESTSNINPFQDAGLLFNLSLVLNSIVQISDNEFAQIANTFKSDLMNSKYRNVSEKIMDPVKHLMYFTKYMYIPARLNYNTIPSYLQLQYIKSWLTIIIILVTKQEYINKYQTVYKNLDIYKRCLDVLMQNEDTRIKMSNTPLASVENILSTAPAPNNGLHNYIQLLSKFIFHINIEIINKFCPNYNACQTVNKKYDGVWLSPLDPDINEQLSKLKSIIN